MRAMGADMIVLRPCYWCGEWPYLHKPDCPVEIGHQRDLEALAATMLCALPASRPKEGNGGG